MSTIAATNLKNASSGTNNVVLNSDGTTTIASPSNIIKSGTAVASTSGTSIDFTSVPSWVKRITVMFSGVSVIGTTASVNNHLIIQIGSSTFTTSGYAAGSTATSTNTSGTGSGQSGLNLTNGFCIFCDIGTAAVNAAMTLVNISGNTWVSSHNGYLGSLNYSVFGGGILTLTGVLDRVRITTNGGSATFDAGTINILYEG